MDIERRNKMDFKQNNLTCQNTICGDDLKKAYKKIKNDSKFKQIGYVVNIEPIWPVESGEKF